MKAQSIEVIFILALMLITFSIALIFPYVSEIGKYGAGYQETSQPVSENIITFTYLTNKTKGFGNNPSFFKEHQVIERISVPYDEELISIVTPDKEILISSKISPSPKLDEAFYNYNILKDYNLESLPIIVEYNVPKAEVKTRTITTSAIAQTTINTVSRKINNLGQVSKTFRFSPLISAKVSSSNLVELAQLSEVKKIWLDRKVEIQLNDSIEIINADDVWDQTDITGNEITGKGIRIAILDTGIDSSHPDFAGKIIAQNDFVPAQYFIDSIDYGDGDDDVVADDHHGHGTHVASIAAGSGAASGGKYKGVAPGAWLVPVKVLNNDGIGFESWIIEAIEYITDPNGDGETFDHFDIASISLGGGGNPDDPISQAVDNAVDKGVVVVVAAGNSGGQAIDGGTISSPGVARKAITVGASDKDDWMAYFSSTGPVIVNINEILIKPDVVAPGYRVCAARLPGSEIDNKIKEEKRESEFFICDDDDYYALSGTSMATPVVSGVVALLLQAHPDWEPEMVKSALMNNAKDLSFNPFTQGAGRIDALKTYNTDAIITPGSSVLGINYLDDNEIWIAKKEFKITNLLDKTVLYNISYYIDQEGIISKIDRNSILLRPYGTSYFNLTLEVNNSLVPDKIYPWYHGKIIAESQYNNLNIPVSFAKIGIIEFHLDNKTHIVSAINDNGSVKWLFYPEEISKVMLPKGNYYFLSLIPYVCPDWYNKSLCWGHQNSYVTLDSIEHKGYTVVYMNRSSVKHKINMSLINENGIDLDPLIRPGGEGTAPRRDCGRHGYEEPCYDGWGTLLYFESPNGTWIKLGLSSGGTNDPNFFSDTSNLWKFSMVRRVVDNDKYYIFKNWTKSIKNDIEFKNGPNDFNKVKFTYKIPPDITDSWRFIWCEYATIAKYYTAMYGTSSFGRTIWNNYNESLFVIPNRDFPIDVCNFTSTTIIDGKLDTSSQGQHLNCLGSCKIYLDSPHRIFKTKEIIEEYVFDFGIPQIGSRINDNVIPVGLHPPYFTARFYNTPYYGPRIYISPRGVCRIFVTQTEDTPYKGIQYKIFENRSGSLILISSGSIKQCRENVYQTPYGKYLVNINLKGFYINDVLGSIDVNATFNTSLIDPNPPRLNSFKILSNGEQTDILNYTANNTIVFELEDESVIPVVRLYYKKLNDATWSRLTLTKNGNTYSVRLPRLPTDYISLKLVAKDDFKNTIEQIVEPAFYHMGHIAVVPVPIPPERPLQPY